MSISYRVEPGDISDYDGIVRMFYEAIHEFEFKNGKYPEKIAVTRPLYAILEAIVMAQHNLSPYLYPSPEFNGPGKLRIMGISMDVIISSEYYFMVGIPVQFSNSEERGK